MLTLMIPEKVTSHQANREYLDIEPVVEHYNTSSTTVEDYIEYLQALIQHHNQTLPSNLARDNDLRCLAMNIYYESRGEPILGQLAVANVTMNRFNASNKTICEIVYARGQFEWTSKRLRPPGGDPWRQSQVIAWIVLNQPELVKDVTNNAHYFHSSTRTPISFKKYDHVITIGGHRFYREKPLIEVAETPDR